MMRMRSASCRGLESIESQDNNPRLRTRQRTQSCVILRSLLKKRDTKRLPPCPPPLSHVGNVMGVDADQIDHPWSAYSRWEAEYGNLK
jgi:hypothetical protein